MKYLISSLLLMSGQIVFAESLSYKSVDTLLETYKDVGIKKDIVRLDGIMDEEVIISDGKSIKDKLDYLLGFDGFVHYCKDVHLRFFDKDIKLSKTKAIVSMQTELRAVCNKKPIHTIQEETIVIKKIDGALKIVKLTNIEKGK